MNVLERITKAKIKLQRTHPFFAYILLNMQIKEMPKDNPMQTMGVDMKGNLYVADEFVKTLSDDELQSVLVHETGHIVLQHLKRNGLRSHELFNISADLTINNILVQNGFKLPKSVLVPSNNEIEIEAGQNKIKIIEIDKKSAEQIYDELYKKLPKEIQKKLDKSRFDVHFEFEDSDSKGEKGEQLSKEEKEALGDKWKKIVAEAGNIAKNIGKVPLGLDRYIDEVLNPKIDYRALLEKYIQALIPYDYDWSLFSKKSYSTGYYMPRMKKEKIDLVLGVDTSGSIGKDELKEFVGEIFGIVRAFNNVTLTLLPCDCEVQDNIEITNNNYNELPTINFKGGGGTSFNPVFEWVRENKPNTQVIIYLTDGYGDLDVENNPNNTIWIISKGGSDERIKDKGVVIRL